MKRITINTYHIFRSLFFKGFMHISKELSKNIVDVESLPKELENASDRFYYKTPKSSQYFQVVIFLIKY
jgi:hypothetical protein